MKKLLLLLIILVFVACDSERNEYYDCADENGRFTRECLNIRYPFSIETTNGDRYGVFVKKNTVEFRYPRSAVWLDEIELYAYPDIESDLAYVPIAYGSFEEEPWFTLSWTEDDGEMIAEIELPDGVYRYWGVDYQYNPCWFYEDVATDNFFVVGEEAKAIFQSPKGVYRWKRWPNDTEPHRPN